MIVGSVKGDEKVITKLKDIPQSVRAKLKVTVTRLSIDLKAYVVANKLSGQVLKRKTGTLARSIQWSVSDRPEGIIGTVGSRAKEGKGLKYAKIHEYGFQGPVTIKQHLRMQKMAFGRAINPVQVTVREHQANMRMPERSFLRSSLRENQSNINAKIAKALNEGVKK